MKVIVHRTLLAEKIAVDKNFLDYLSQEASKGILGGGLIAAIVFIVTSLSYLTYGIFFKTTVIVFAPTWIPAICALIIGGTTIAAISALLKKFGILGSNDKVLPASFSSRLDELGVVVYGLVFLPAAAVLLVDGKMTKKNKEILQKSLEEWGYSSEWSKYKIEEMSNGNPNAIIVTTKALWKVYKAHFKKYNKKKPIDANSNSFDFKLITEDLPNPESIKQKMLELSRDFVAGSCSSKQEDYIKNLEKF